MDGLLTQPVITAERFNRMVAPAMGPCLLWGAKAIARRIGRSPDFVRTTLAQMPNSPVHVMGRSLYAVEDELLGFFRNPSGDNPTPARSTA